MAAKRIAPRNKLEVGSIKVSVIIATKQEENNIANCINSVREQVYPGNIEIIVVDNHSSDKTLEIARQYSAIVYVIGASRGAQLNLGVKRATGKYLLYLDADMILSENVIGECVDTCEKENCVALYIPESITGKGFFAKIRNFERSFYNATCIDAVRFVNRQKFIEVKGFDEDLLFGPDDWDFDRRLKQAGRTSIIRNHLYHNESIINIRKYLRKKKDYVHTFGGYIKKWGKSDLIIRKQLGLYYRFFGVFVENGKWRKLIAHPFLTGGMYILRFLVGINFLVSKN